jgi:hypothetical protein
MPRNWIAALAIVAALLVLWGGISTAQFEDNQTPSLPIPTPPPPPPEKPPESAVEYKKVVEDSGEPWDMPEDLLANLAHKARIYQAVLQSFTCDESVRRAEYGGGGDVDKEKENRYGYLLVKDPLSERIRESRREFSKKGELKSGEVADAEPFPPAYEWVFLFSDYHQSLFSYRYVGQQFDGFDLVHEIEFKGALPFTSGRDIRQWEGRVLVDAFTFTPIEVHAEPTGQRERIRQMFAEYNKSFNALGMRTGKKPLGYQAQVRFGYRKDLQSTEPIRLTFPTELRYDTERAVGPHSISPVRASTRTYTNYKFYTTEISPEMLGELAQAPD